MEEEERLDLSKGKERFRKTGFAESMILIPFAPVSEHCRKYVGNGWEDAAEMDPGPFAL